ncbi:MAG: hypothetical protein CL484_03175 [Acidobacteria bacterium]|nr:hypothetical protein [Acidobacteriota bacterium]
MSDDLTKADPHEDTPIAELFARNPGDLGDSDINAIIAKLRKQRHRFVAGDKTAGKAKPSKTSKAQEAATNVTGKLDLGDLGL